MRYVSTSKSKRMLAFCATSVVVLTGFAVIGSAARAATPVQLIQHPARVTTADFPPNTDFVVPWTKPPTAGDTFLVFASHYCSVHPSSTLVVTSDSGKWVEIEHAHGVP